MCSCTLIDDFSYVTKDQAETSVLFELISANWSNLPARITRFERNGVRAGDLRDTQRAALFDFVSAALRREGADLVHKA